MLNDQSSAVHYLKTIASLLTEYSEQRLDEAKLELVVRNVTLSVILTAKLESGRYAPYLMTSETDEGSETGGGFRVVPKLEVQPADDAEKVALNIREALGPPDA